MTALLIYPAFKDRASFYDQLFRAVWHFLPMAGRIHQMVFLYTGEDYQEIDVNEILTATAKNIFPLILTPQLHNSPRNISIV